MLNYLVLHLVKKTPNRVVTKVVVEEKVGIICTAVDGGLRCFHKAVPGTTLCRYHTMSNSGTKKVAPAWAKTKVPKGRKVTKADGRLSARSYYDNGGEVGDVCDIRQDGTYKCLLKRGNGSPYWEKCTEGVLENYSECGDCSSNCNMEQFA